MLLVPIKSSSIWKDYAYDLCFYENSSCFCSCRTGFRSTGGNVDAVLQMSTQGRLTPSISKVHKIEKGTSYKQNCPIEHPGHGSCFKVLFILKRLQDDLWICYQRQPKVELIYLDQCWAFQSFVITVSGICIIILKWTGFWYILKYCSFINE